MRKIFTLTFFLCIVLFADAQTNKGDVLLGGSLGITHTDSKVDPSNKMNGTSISIAPTIGRFYAPNRMAGINIAYSHFKDVNSNYKSDMFTAGLFLRQYLPFPKSFYVFAEEGINAGTGSGNQFQYLNFKSTSASIYFYGGVAYAITRRLQVELALNPLASLSYLHTKQEDSSNPQNTRTTTTDQFTLSAISTSSLANLAFGMKFRL